ncbi:hypothetical protein GDO86_018264 [Hymenochirus boettgeri]|uniref:G-protein coupled receptors family 1 profile domain-containing protein n=1 Tax=Hymenochirus boettgeri TaxID=247094 RepID=A0A8T2ICA7_9PIPI|nr:hypothetical protein GDO86_018264 [Hymenochirus boettgeri]
MASSQANFTSNSSAECVVNKEFTFRFLPSVYLIVFLVGLLGNVCGLWNLYVDRKNWSSLNIFMINLGLADLLYVITLPFFVSYYLEKEMWHFGLIFCRFTRALFQVNMYASISFLTCISVQRYLGIVHPLKTMGRLHNLRCSVYISALVWIWVIAQVMAGFFITKDDNDLNRCYDSTSNKDENLKRYALYNLIITLTGFFIPFLIIVVCYARILTVLWRNKNIDPILKGRSIKLVGIVLTLFFICFFPYYILRNFSLISRTWQLQGTCTSALKTAYVTYQVTRGLASMNSAINPLLYFVTNESFVSRFHQMRRRTFHAFVYLGRSRDRQLVELVDV